jgi:hypothetical protein
MFVGEPAIQNEIVKSRNEGESKFADTSLPSPASVQPARSNWMIIPDEGIARWTKGKRPDCTAN